MIAKDWGFFQIKKGRVRNITRQLQIDKFKKLSISLTFVCVRAKEKCQGDDVAERERVQARIVR
jgi:hypothetical protein